MENAFDNERAAWERDNRVATSLDDFAYVRECPVCELEFPTNDPERHICADCEDED
jgi:hypothetical protein